MESTTKPTAGHQDKSAMQVQGVPDWIASTLRVALKNADYQFVALPKETIARVEDAIGRYPEMAGMTVDEAVRHVFEAFIQFVGVLDTLPGQGLPSQLDPADLNIALTNQPADGR